MPQIILPADANAPEHTVDCHDCGDRLDAEALTTHWDESGDPAFCGICVKNRTDDACQKGIEALRLVARLTRAYQNKTTARPSEFVGMVQEVLALNPDLLDLAAEVLDADTAPQEPQTASN